jgi:hypothetical protein
MFKKKNQTDEALAKALARVDEVLDERSRIVAAVAKTATDVHATEAELQRALDQLAVEEAVVALTDDNMPDRETAAQRSVQRLRLRLEAQRARLCGLDRRVTEHEDQVRDANEILIVARDAWVRARIAEFSIEYRRAVDAMAAVLRKGVAIGDALGTGDLSAAMRQAKLYDPENLSCSMIDMEPVRSDPASGLMQRHPVWEDDPAAKAVHDGLVHVRVRAETTRPSTRPLRRSR